METSPVKCPNCGSTNIAEILWGLPAFTEKLKERLDEGKVVLGGCCISDDDPKYECNECKHRFGPVSYTHLTLPTILRV